MNNLWSWIFKIFKSSNTNQPAAFRYFSTYCLVMHARMNRNRKDIAQLKGVYVSWQSYYAG